MMSPMKFANEFLKEATRLKKEKKYLEAIKMLDKAYEVGTPGDTPPNEDNPNEITDDIKYNIISTDNLLRKGMYLQLAGKPKEGLKYLKNLRDTYIKKFDETQDTYYLEPNIYLQIGRLLDKEKDYKEALKNRALSFLLDSFLPYFNSRKMQMKNDEHKTRGKKKFIENYFKRYIKKVDKFNTKGFCELMSELHQFEKNTYKLVNIKKIEKL